MVVDPNPLRWDPPDAPNRLGYCYVCMYVYMYVCVCVALFICLSVCVRGVSQDFVEGLRLLCGSGDPCSKTGLAIYTYTLNRDMTADLTLPPTAEPTDPAAHPTKRSRTSSPSEPQVMYVCMYVCMYEYMH